jgi:hypothetical protein
VPNMTRAMAEFPPVLEGYMSLSSALSKGSLGMTSPQHSQVSAFWETCPPHSLHSTIARNIS